MNGWFLVLVMLAGLGSCFSFGQAAAAGKFVDPFDTYLKSESLKQREGASLRFAHECDVNLDVATVRFADRPDNAWLMVRDLAKGIHGLETDFFATAAVRKQGDKLLVEMWEMELDVGSESRRFYCLNSRRITLFETTQWTLPVDETDGNMSGNWGYEQHWKVDSNSKYVNSLRRFVDSQGAPITSPKLDAQTLKGLHWTPTEKSWTDLKLPSEMLR